MNELESFYSSNSQMGQSLGMIQRGEVQQRVNALGVQEAKDDIQGGLFTEKEKTEEEGGGVGLGAGLLTKEGIAVAGKSVLKSATEKARGVIQSKVDDLIARKGAGTLDEVVGTGQNIAKVTRLGARPVVGQPLANTQPVASSATTTAQPAVGSSRANQIIDQDDNLIGDQNLVRGGVTRDTDSFLDKAKALFTRGGNTENQINTGLDEAGAITKKTMSDLGNKIGVDFGNLSKGDIAESLGNTFGKAGLDAEKISSGLGFAGEALEYLGPIGMVAGLGASIAGIFESKKINSELATKQNDINTMTDNINSMGGMSFGSISNTALDTSQFRSGGESGNY